MKRIALIPALIFTFSLGIHKDPAGYPAKVLWVEPSIENTDMVHVITVDSNLDIVFEVYDKDVLRFRTAKDNSTEVKLQFDCLKDKNGDCDFLNDFVLKVDGVWVNIARWSICKGDLVRTSYVLENLIIHHSPESGYKNGLILSGSCGGKTMFLTANVENDQDLKSLVGMQRGDTVD